MNLAGSASIGGHLCGIRRGKLMNGIRDQAQTCREIVDLKHFDRATQVWQRKSRLKAE